MVHVSVEELVTGHMYKSRAETVNTSVYGPQRFTVSVYVFVKVTDCPPARESRVKTVVLGTGLLLTTTILVSVVLPLLETVPLKVTSTSFPVRLVAVKQCFVMSQVGKGAIPTVASAKPPALREQSPISVLPPL